MSLFVSLLLMPLMSDSIILDLTPYSGYSAFLAFASSMNLLCCCMYIYILLLPQEEEMHIWQHIHQKD